MCRVTQKQLSGLTLEMLLRQTSCRGGKGQAGPGHGGESRGPEQLTQT